MKTEYSLIDVSSLVEAAPSKARALAEAFVGHAEPYSFQEVVILRTAKRLMELGVSRRRVSEVLERLSRELPDSAALSAVAIISQGTEIIVGVGSSRWSVESGQQVLELRGPPASTAWLRPVPRRDAQQLFNQAVTLEENDPSGAVDAYAEAVAANPLHADAHVNLGRLLHQRGRLQEAEAHYVAALVARPADATATFNLAVVLEDLGREDEAIDRYHDALQLDRQCVDAYFNLARLYEKKGEKMAAIRHLKDYRRLSRA